MAHIAFFGLILLFVFPYFTKSCSITGASPPMEINRNFPIFVNLFNRCRVGHHPLSLSSKSVSGLGLLILLAGDIATNPGPDSFGYTKLAFTNIRSLKKNHVPLSQYVKINNIDIVGLSETWLSSSETTSLINTVSPDGFTLLHRPRIGKIGGGVGFLIRENITSTVIKSPIYKSFENLVVNCNFQHRSVNFVSVYRPPGSTTTFLDEFVTFLDFLLSLSSDPVILGDFNIDPKKHSAAYIKYSEILGSANLKQHVDVMTHLHGSILDHFITPVDSDLLQKRVCINDCITDHMCMLATLMLSCSTETKPKVVSFRKYHKIDMDSLKRDLASSELLLNPSLSSSGELYDQYHTVLTSILDRHAPVCNKNSYRLSEKWLSVEFFEAKRLKRYFERIWRRTKSVLNRSKFRRQVNKCNSIINNSKSKFYSDLIDENVHDPKKLWKSLHTVMHRTRISVLPEDPSNTSLANKFCNYFIDKINNIRSNFIASKSPSFTPERPPPPFSDFSTVSCEEVRKIILNSPTKSCSLDPWPTFLIKDCLDILIKPLTQLVNLSLSQGVFPDKFKSAIITPLIKKPSLDKNVLKNYRPVSGLNFVSKVIERVVAKQLNQFISLNNLNNSYQSAYKSGHSTETTLLKIKSDIHLNMAQNKPTALILLDLSAAFDTIDHLQLLERLKVWFGFTGTVLNWFTSYLNDRSQSVKVNESVSAAKPLAHGVPQGSVLGPLIFILFTYPLSIIISGFSNVSHHLYADDTQIYIAITPDNATTAIPQLQSCLSSVQNWMNANKLKLNPDKTEFIVFGSELHRSQLSHLFPVEILGNALFPTDKVRNLGVIFDSSFSFSAQVSAICSSSYYHIRDFARIRRYLKRPTAITLANALVSSRLDYCNSLLDSITQYDMKRLRSIQYSVCRIINRISRYSNDRMSPHLKSLHWLPIRQRIDFKWYLLMFKIVKYKLPPYFNSYFVPYTSPVATRRSVCDKMFLSRDIIPFDRKLHKSKTQYDNCFYISGPGKWNMLPPEIRCAKTLNTFRKKLKTYLFEQAYPP